ncbi:hypothetical protein FNF27_00562 [Cafeteria roenbergensis]|uniref:Dynein light chain n=1 Tax=Cafeteria roenbergensis TaxID=33653 RepID=A0A5A8E2E5_CAFRO|nr:hypothetical protein FNF29_00132 [Cafeteria roenbergensis]KAA0160440.1 hypothetical protein FNF31_04309 [Cafeteria roenbergensis]KAA0171976.1 hypothetical protein FNF28_00293 [Cafeteria roenbergensis]KAA0178014.1 hypothetical protein FNF27_00562 [Cafeteria roenbergensis]|eukprot:KAA0157556.1 hypothetical protein FNF29_00132 [Cafeteria roenbergensis]
MASAEFKKVMAKPLVKHTDMPHEMSSEAVEIVVSAVDKYLTSENFEKASQMIKENMDKRYGPTWHCVIGEGFGFEITYESRQVLYMQYQERHSILVYKC